MMINTRELLLYKDDASGSAPYSTTKLREEKRRDILCKSCQTQISTTEKLISIAGSVEHTFKNPAGIIYTIVCLSSAYGCMLIGTPVEDFSWFTGYKWRYALCHSCDSHLGWNYVSGEVGFFGLIKENVLF